MTQYKTVHDSMGELQVPADALYGAQTQRALDNFPQNHILIPPRFIQAIGVIKYAAATANEKLGLLDKNIATAIRTASEKVMRYEPEVAKNFPLDVFQTGSGTSTNMNANEVIATLASLQSGIAVHPNDHVNMSQSSNDVIPTAIHVSAAAAIHDQLLPALTHLTEVIDKKAFQLKDIVKTGRTHLMDAMPVRMDQELGGWAMQIRLGIERIKSTLPRLYALAQGGTAVGTGINAAPEFPKCFVAALQEKTQLPFTVSPNFFESLSSQDTAVELSGQLKVIACSLMKISNDLRWMNSGPLAGLGEIALPALQPGSSIMPGKVNPVIPEAVCMIAAQVIGNDATITVAGQSGNFQLLVMLPVIAYNLLQSIFLLSNAAMSLADKAIEGFTVQTSRINEQLARNPILVTALNRVIGYELGAKIAKIAYKENRAVKEVALQYTQLSGVELDRLLDPAELTKGGVKE